MKWLPYACLGLASLAWADPPELMSCTQALSFVGENVRAGRCAVRVAPATDAPGDAYTLELRFRLSKHQKGEWIDAHAVPSPPLDLSGSRVQRIWIRAEQESPWLTAKICDPDNPGANRAAFEQALAYAGNPLPANRWVPVDIELPEEPVRRDAINYVGFYLAAADERIPLDQDLVFQVGRFPFALPPRAPWPPQAAGGGQAGTPVLEPPFAADGRWILVRDENNQTDHPARIEGGAVVFDADANGWNEFLWSDAARVPIRPLTAYRLAFDYEILRGAGGEQGACFYSLVRAEGTIREDVGWARWSPPTGAKGTRILTFTTHDMPGYRLIFGIRHQGAIRISNLSLSELPAAKGGAR